jgi:hypothetical protein
MQVFQDMEGHGAYYTNLMNEGTYNENYEDILDTHQRRLESKNGKILLRKKIDLLCQLG